MEWSHPEIVHVDRRLRIGAEPHRKQVRTGHRIWVRGAVKVRAGKQARKRLVRLQERIDGDWRPRARKLTKRTGSYRFVVKAGQRERVRVFRVVAPRSHGLRRAHTKPIRVRVVTPAVKPTPSPSPEPTPSSTPSPSPTGPTPTPEPTGSPTPA
ncbi:MAG: hypothetical protein HZY75_13965 [Nocardioidaceae bacterium]|nr:MAG: hypothetical protein HZY75_13965 [Nocardioidaceae bacterium]